MNAALIAKLATNNVSIRWRVYVHLTSDDSIIYRWATAKVDADTGINAHTSSISFPTLSEGAELIGGFEENTVVSFNLDNTAGLYADIVARDRASVYFKVYISDASLGYAEADLGDWEDLGKLYYVDRGASSVAVGSLSLESVYPSKGKMIGTDIIDVYTDADLNKNEIIPISYGQFNTSGTSDAVSYFYRFTIDSTGSDFDLAETVTQSGVFSPTGVVTGFDISGTVFVLWVKTPTNPEFFAVGQTFTGGSSSNTADILKIEYMGYPTTNVSPDTPTNPKLAKARNIGKSRYALNPRKVTDIDGIYTHSKSSQQYYRLPAAAVTGSVPRISDIDTASRYYSYLYWYPSAVPPSPWYYLVGGVEIIKSELQNSASDGSYYGMKIIERGCFGTPITDHNPGGVTYALQYYFKNTDEFGNAIIKSLPTSITNFDIDTVSSQVNISNSGNIVDGDTDTAGSITLTDDVLLNRVSFNVDVLEYLSEGFNPPIVGDVMNITDTGIPTGIDGQFTIETVDSISTNNYAITGRVTAEGHTLIEGIFLLLVKVGVSNNVKLEIATDPSEYEIGGVVDVYKNSTDLFPPNMQYALAKFDGEIDPWGEGNLQDGGQGSKIITTVFDYHPNETVTAGDFTDPANCWDGNSGTFGTVALAGATTSGQGVFGYSVAPQTLPVMYTSFILRVMGSSVRNSDIIDYTDPVISLGSISGNLNDLISTSMAVKTQGTAQGVATASNIVDGNTTTYAVFTPVGATEAHLNINFYDVSTQPVFLDYTTVTLELYMKAAASGGGFTPSETQQSLVQTNEYANTHAIGSTNITSPDNIVDSTDSTYAIYTPIAYASGDFQIDFASSVTIPGMNKFGFLQIALGNSDDSILNDYKAGNFVLTGTLDGADLNMLFTDPYTSIDEYSASNWLILRFPITQQIAQAGKIPGDTWNPTLDITITDDGSYTQPVNIYKCELQFEYYDVTVDSTNDDQIPKFQVKAGNEYANFDLPADLSEGWRQFPITQLMLGNAFFAGEGADEDFTLIATQQGSGGSASVSVSSARLSFANPEVSGGSNVAMSGAPSITTPGIVEAGTAGITIYAEIDETGTATWKNVGEFVVYPTTVSGSGTYHDFDILSAWNPGQSGSLTPLQIRLTLSKETNSNSDYGVRIHDCYVSASRSNMFDDWNLVDVRVGINDGPLMDFTGINANVSHIPYYLDVTSLLLNQYSIQELSTMQMDEIIMRIDISGNGPVDGTIVNIYGVDLQVIGGAEDGGSGDIGVSGQMMDEDGGGWSTGGVVELFEDVMVHLIDEVGGFASADWIDTTSFTALRSGDTLVSAFQILERSDLHGILEMCGYCRDIKIKMNEDGEYEAAAISSASGLALTTSDINQDAGQVNRLVDMSKVYYNFSFKFNIDQFGTYEVTETQSTAGADYNIYSDYSAPFDLPVNNTTVANFIRDSKAALFGSIKQPLTVKCSILGLRCEPGQSMTLPTAGAVNMTRRTINQGGFTNMMTLEVEKTT